MIDRDNIIRMARKAGIAKHGLGWTCWESQLERFAELVAAAEREACAKYLQDQNTAITDKLAAEIRARGQA